MKTYKVEIDSCGTINWYKENTDLLHREGGPAVEQANGTKEWWLNGKLHREDGPAIEGANGTKSWFINGKRHREDGAAIEWDNGTKSWFIDDKRLTVEEFNARTHKSDGKTVEIEGKRYKLTLID